MEGFRPEILEEIMVTKMPFGKYKGTILINLPDFYLEWFHRKGMPPGKLGMQMSTVYEIKLNGLMNLVKPLMKGK